MAVFLLYLKKYMYSIYLHVGSIICKRLFFYLPLL